MRLSCYFYNRPQSTHSCFQHPQSACLKARCRAWPKGLVQLSSAPNDAKPPIINYRFSKSFLNELLHSINKAYYIISKRSVNKNFKNIPESVWWNNEFWKLLVGDLGLEPRRTGSKPALLTNYSNPHQTCILLNFTAKNIQTSKWWVQVGTIHCLRIFSPVYNNQLYDRPVETNSRTYSNLNHNNQLI